MLILRRKSQETIQVHHAGETLTITLIDTQGDAARIGFEGNKSFRVVRTEIEFTEGKETHVAPNT